MTTVPQWAVHQLVSFAARTEYELSPNEAGELLWNLASEGLTFNEAAQNLTTDIDPMLLATACREYILPEPRELPRVFGDYSDRLNTGDYRRFNVYLDEEGCWRQSHPTDPKGNDVLVTANNITIDEDCITWQFPWRDKHTFEAAASRLNLEVSGNRNWINSQVIEKVLKTRQRQATSDMTSTQRPYPPPVEKLYECPRCLWGENGWEIGYEQKWFCD